MIVPVVIHSNGASLRTYALLDSGATGTAVSTKIADKLNMPTYFDHVTVSSFGCKDTQYRKLTNLTVEPLDNTFRLDINRALVGEILTTEGDSPPNMLDIENCSHMEGRVWFDELDDEHIGLMLSARYAYTWQRGEVLSAGIDDPIAIRTMFGWALIGPTGQEADDEIMVGCCKAEVPNARTISEDIAKMFRHDFIAREGEKGSPEECHPSREDQHALRQFNETVKFDPELGHYKCGLPWVRDRQSAAKTLNQIDSATNSINRLKKATNRMRREPARREGVWKQMNEILEEGHARKVDQSEVPEGTPKTYLPLLVVTRPDKPNKFRCCHDAASRVNGVCLNDILLSGPDLVNRLVGVLLRYRQKMVGISADIRGFFHQIYVDDRDRAVFRFHWWEDAEMTKLIELEMYVHIFGAKSSPAVATFVLRYHGKQMEGEFSAETVSAILRSFYVDDLLASYESVEKAKKIRMELVEALKRGGFDLVKWKSTHQGVLDEADEKEAESQAAKTFDDPTVMTATEKVLGVSYSFQSDDFTIRIGCRAKESVSTRREMLSLVASVFDPLGLVAPGLLKGKIIFQKATALSLDWDDPLPEEIHDEFEEWRSKLGVLESIKIPRWLATPETVGGLVELHLFSDASLEGYGVSGYIKHYKGDKSNVTLVFSKAHVVPIEMSKRMMKDEENHHSSIPRLELTAARLAAILKDMILRELEIEVLRTILWTDSECVLKWIRDRKSRFKTFIKNRLSKIHELTHVEEWRHVPGVLNPADDVSRGLEPGDPKWQRFLRGPDFLWLDESEWPKESPAAKSVVSIGALAEERVVQKDVEYDWAVKVVDKIDEWPAKIRRLAIFVNFLKLWRKNRGSKIALTKMYPTVRDMEDARVKLVTGIQQNHFQTEIDVLKNNAEISPRLSKLACLNPFLDLTGTLRVGGRLANATNMSYDAKHPMILPKSDQNVESLIRAEHQKLGHAGVNHTFSSLAMRFWIVNGREAVKQSVNKCVTCQKLFKPPCTQKMGDLPNDRVESRAPFESTGIDMFGPFRVKNGGRKFYKRWVIIFTCCQSRAVHFECIRDISSSSFLNALFRFHARRPGLRVIYSDQGTNFVGGDRELQRAVECWNRETVGELVLRGIDWKYSPPHAPHYGGMWERIIRTAKNHLSAMLSKDNLDIEVFVTVLVEVERIINTRPLCYASSDPRDMTVLTPANLLYPGVVMHSSVNILPPAPPGGEKIRFQWKRAREVVDVFLTRWSHEYLTTLQKRSKWEKTQKNLQIGQLVLLVDENMPRDQWRVGMINAVVSNSNLVRRVTVRLANGRILERHVNKVVGLELDE